MITIEQCRAARGLLGWTQQDLADACGLSKTAINNFEKGHSDIKTESLRAVRMAFESLNVEFTGQDGLRRCHDRADVLKGIGAYNSMLDNILPASRQSGSEFLIFNMNDNLSRHITLDKLQTYISELEKHDITTRILYQEGANIVPGTAAQSRWISKEQSKYMPIRLVYGSNVALQFGQSAFLTLISSRDESQSHRKEFDAIWAEASIQKNAKTAPAPRAKSTSNT